MPSITVREYYPAAGSKFSKEDAETIGPSLVELSKEGKSSPEHVVDRARSSNSPLHAYFEWDDKKAAHLYRVDQAGEILRAIKIKYVSNGVERTSRAIYSVKRQGDDDRAQERSIKVLHGETAFAFQMLENAVNDIRAWQKRYGPYEEMWDSFRLCLREVMSHADDVIRVLDVENLSGQADEALRVLLSWRDSEASALEACMVAPQALGGLREAMAKAEAVFAKLEAKHKRKCIQCQRNFLSTGPGNRMCDPCRKKTYGDEFEITA